MPFKSEAQRRYMYANKPDLAKEWAEKYGVPTDLPERVRRKKKSPRRSGLLSAWDRNNKKFSR